MISVPQERGFVHFNEKGITAIQYYPTQKIAVISDAEGELLKATVNDRSAFDQLVSDVKAAGVDLINIPVYSQGEEFPQYISPAAVTFVTSSQADKHGKIAAIVGVMGAGRIDTGATTKATIDTIVEKTAKVKKLLPFTAEEASARFYKPDMLYIAPDAILKISTYEERVDIHFAWAGQLDVSLSAYSFDQFKKTPDEEFSVVYARQKEKSVEASKASEAFADMLASYNPLLTKVKGLEKQSAYVRVQDYTYFATWEGRVGDVDRKFGYSLQPRNRNTDGYQASFNNAAARDASLAPLLSAMGLGQKKKPSGPMPRGH